jgi:hypothetical protein
MSACTYAVYRSVIGGLDLGRFPRRATSAADEKPLAAGDAYTVELDAERIGTTSATYAWVIGGPAGICARGSHAVHVDETGRPAPFPDALRERLAGSREGTGRRISPAGGAAPSAARPQGHAAGA